MSVVIETTIGDVTVDLFTEERPVACLNFMKLCRLKYYNYNLFHTVERGFIAQTGDPTGTGDGGSSVWGVIEGPKKRFCEAESLPKIKHTRPGLVSLVSVGKQLVGSQFFFTLASDLTSLDGIHCVIGEVVEGHETLRKLNESIVDEKFRPFQDIRITHTVILDDPYPNPRAFRVPSRSPSPSAERLVNGRIGADEDIDDTDGKTVEEIQEMLEEREAKARATILEIVGDLPDADMAPPENVLFVCKLNPITTDDDLEIIFGRFGKVKNCEVIRDKKSGDSLQYAFVEFEEKASCEAAYFKMDNVLIDDRRIHVDFSQSISKVTWRGKGRGVEGVEGRLDFNKLKSHSKSSNQQRSREETHRNREKGRERFKSEESREEPQHKREKGRERLTSVERRKAREERHRALEQEESRRHSARSRSRGRKYINDTPRYRNEDLSNNGRGSVHKLREYSPRGRDYQDNNSCRRQSGHDRDRVKERYSLTRQRQESTRDSHHRSYNEDQRKSHSGTEKHIQKSSTNEHKSVKKVKENHSKKRKQETSSDGSSSDSSESNSTTSSSDSSSQSTSSSTSSSSSEDERSRKKTRSKPKRRNNNQSSKTSRKQIKKKS